MAEIDRKIGGERWKGRRKREDRLRKRGVGVGEVEGIFGNLGGRKVNVCLVDQIVWWLCGYGYVLYLVN